MKGLSARKKWRNSSNYVDQWIVRAEDAAIYNQALCVSQQVASSSLNDWLSEWRKSAVTVRYNHTLPSTDRASMAAFTNFWRHCRQSSISSRRRFCQKCIAITTTNYETMKRFCNLAMLVHSGESGGREEKIKTSFVIIHSQVCVSQDEIRTQDITICLLLPSWSGCWRHSARSGSRACLKVTQVFLKVEMTMKSVKLLMARSLLISYLFLLFLFFVIRPGAATFSRSERMRWRMLENF